MKKSDLQDKLTDIVEPLDLAGKLSVLGFAIGQALRDKVKTQSETTIGREIDEACKTIRGSLERLAHMRQPSVGFDEYVEACMQKVRTAVREGAGLPRQELN